MKSDTKEGFTLIEVLVVIGILGILASILVPAITTVRRKANRAACLSNLHQIALSVKMYATDYRNYPSVTNMPSLNLNSLPSISEALSQYTDNDNVFRCPADQEFFYKESSSYEWNIHLNGQLASKFSDKEQMPMLFDYEPFHGDPAYPDSRNVVYINASSEGL